MPRQFPALIRAEKVAEKAIKAKVITTAENEALAIALKQIEALKFSNEPTEREKILGEALFALSVYAERSSLSAERALTYRIDRLLETIKSDENIEK